MRLFAFFNSFLNSAGYFLHSLTSLHCFDFSSFPLTAFYSGFVSERRVHLNFDFRDISTIAGGHRTSNFVHYQRE